MALRNRSVATIDAPEFINLAEDALNPGISKCEIKVFYLGKNRNGSYIDKNTAIQMANSLPATPIVACYRKDIEDFGDHGSVIHIENGEIEFSVNTIPYGFVAPDAEVWFQKFIDTDEFGNDVEREYMMTTGYLWTGQYPELDKVIQEGQGQSMELGEDMDGHWATDNSTGVEFFIINDAVFTKLCILGDDVEPCFEGASVEAPQVSKEFAANNFNRTLFSMMNELKHALENKGGSDMPNEEIQVETEETTEFTEAEENQVAAVETAAESEFAEEVVPETEPEEGNDTAEEFAKKDDEDDDSDESNDAAESDEEDSSDASDESDDDDEEDKKKPAAKHALESELADLQARYNELASEVEELRAFKLARENADKDALIAKYHMLSDEDKAEVVANKEKYSLDEIEGKLALIYVQKNVDFETVDGQVEDEVEASPVATFSLEDTNETADEADAFLQALRNTNLF